VESYGAANEARVEYPVWTSGRPTFGYWRGHNVGNRKPGTISKPTGPAPAINGGKRRHFEVFKGIEDLVGFQGSGNQISFREKLEVSKRTR